MEYYAIKTQDISKLYSLNGVEVKKIPFHLTGEYREKGYCIVSNLEYLKLEIENRSLQKQIEEFEKNKNERLSAIYDSILEFNQNYGLKLIINFGRRNVVSEKSESQIDEIMENQDVMKLCISLISGSYKYALRKVDQINIPSITDDDKEWFKSEIIKVLGVEK